MSKRPEASAGIDSSRSAPTQNARSPAPVRSTDAHGGVVARVGPRLPELLVHVERQRVELRRPVEADLGDAAG